MPRGSTELPRSDSLLELLDVEVDSRVLGAVGPVPVDLSLGVIAVAVDGEPVAATLGEVALLVHAEAGSVGAVGSGAGVRARQADGRDGVFDDVKVLPAGRGFALGRERNRAILTLATDWVEVRVDVIRVELELTDGDLLGGGVGADPEVLYNLLASTLKLGVQATYGRRSRRSCRRRRPG